MIHENSVPSVDLGNEILPQGSATDALASSGPPHLAQAPANSNALTAETRVLDSGPQTKPVPRNRFTADACLLVTAVAWGTNIPLVKNAMSSVDSWVFNFSRLALATVVLGVLALLERRYRSTKIKRFSVGRFLVFSLLSGFFYQFLFFKGITATTAGNTALLLSSMPMWTAILSFLFLSERLPKVTWVGLAVTFVGTVIVTTQSGSVDLSSQYLMGNLFILGGAFAWASATVLSKPLFESMTPLQLSFASSLITMPLHFWMAWGLFESSSNALQQTPTILAIIYSGAISTGVAYATWHYGVRQLGGSHAAVYQNLVTLVAVTGGWLFLKESIMAAQLVGGVAIILGLLLMRKGRAASQSKPAPHLNLK